MYSIICCCNGYQLYHLLPLLLPGHSLVIPHAPFFGFRWFCFCCCSCSTTCFHVNATRMSGGRWISVVQDRMNGGDPEVVPLWNSLIIKIFSDKSNLFIYFQEQYFVGHSGTAVEPSSTPLPPLEATTTTTVPCIVQVLCSCRSTNDSSARIQLSSSVVWSWAFPLSLFLCPFSVHFHCPLNDDTMANSSSAQRDPVREGGSGHGGGLNCPAVTINCVAVTRNIIISFRIYFCIIIPPTNTNDDKGHSVLEWRWWLTWQITL